MSFKFVLKYANESILQRMVDRSFQRVGAATSLVAGISNKFVSAERVLYVVCFYPANHLDIWVLFHYMLSKLEQVS